MVRLGLGEWGQRGLTLPQGIDDRLWPQDIATARGISSNVRPR